MIFLILLFFPVIGKVFSAAAWDPNKRPFRCDANCWKGFKDIQDPFDTSHCDKTMTEYGNLLLGGKKTIQVDERTTICSRSRNVTRISQSSRPSSDYRLICRPVTDRMTWYRGPQRVTVRNKPCLRWDSVTHSFSETDFSRFSAPSLSHTLSRLSRGVSQHENYCRNPDDDKLGPWCFYKAGNKTKREPCFHPCVDTVSELCLSKTHFPFRTLLGHSSLEIVAPLSKRTISSIPEAMRDKVVKHNLATDLSDVLDVPFLIDNIPDAAPLYTPISSSPLRWATSSGQLVSTRKRCYQTGLRASVAGPWHPIKKEVPSLLLDNLIAPNRSLPLDRTSSPPFELAPWVPCFAACQDHSIRCWPRQKLKKDILSTTWDRYEYYGDRTRTVNNDECMPWMEAIAEQLKLLAGDSERADYLRYVFYTKVLLDPRFSNEGRLFFREAQVHLMNSPRCLDLGKLLSLKKVSINTIFRTEMQNGKKKPFFMADATSLLEDLLNGGPGCFYKKEGVIRYSPCFPECACPIDKNEAPPPVVNKLCDNGGAMGLCKKAAVSVDILGGRKIETKIKPRPPVSSPVILYVLPTLAIASASAPLLQCLLTRFWR